MSQLTTVFEFEIGEIVYFKRAPHHMTERPRMFQIVEQLAQRCPGGIQRHYRIKGDGDINTVLEIELTRTMPAYERRDPARLDEVLHEKYVDQQISDVVREQIIEESAERMRQIKRDKRQAEDQSDDRETT